MTKELEAKGRMREVETVVIVREECELCNGTGLLTEKEHTYDCGICQGHGMNQVSRKAVIDREFQ